MRNLIDAQLIVVIYTEWLTEVGTLSCSLLSTIADRILIQVVL